MIFTHEEIHIREIHTLQKKLIYKILIIAVEKWIKKILKWLEISVSFLIYQLAKLIFK